MRQVGYLQRLYRDARSTEHKIIVANCSTGSNKILLFLNSERIYLLITTTTQPKWLGYPTSFLQSLQANVGTRRYLLLPCTYTSIIRHLPCNPINIQSTKHWTECCGPAISNSNLVLETGYPAYLCSCSSSVTPGNVKAAPYIWSRLFPSMSCLLHYSQITCHLCKNCRNLRARMVK